MSEQKETPIQQIRRVCAVEGHFELETNVRVEDMNPDTPGATDNEGEGLVRSATPGETTAGTQKATDDFISTYVKYADVLEAPPEAHEAVATELIASALCEKVLIKHGAVKIPLDLWLLLLSGSGFGRNTLLTLAQPVLDAANLKGLIRKATWGSRIAFYQALAEQPYGLFVWPELSVILKKFDDKSFSGTKEWVTDLYDNLDIPEPVRYRVTGKKSDTPPIVFKHAPRLNILATSSVDWFLSNIAQEDALGGFVPRWVLKKIGGGRIVPIPRRPDQSLITPLAERLCKAAELSGEADLSHVYKYYDLWYRQTQQRFSEHPNASLADPFFRRLRTHVLKLAVVYEVSQSLSLVVTPPALGRAIRAARASEESIFALLATGLSREGAEVDRMAEVIRKAGADGISQSEITRVFQGIRSTERQSRLETLIQAKTVHRFSRGTSGRPALMLVHRGHVAEYRQQHPEEREREY
jgi:hypothetical protein